MEWVSGDGFDDFDGQGGTDKINLFGDAINGDLFRVAGPSTGGFVVNHNVFGGEVVGLQVERFEISSRGGDDSVMFFATASGRFEDAIVNLGDGNDQIDLLVMPGHVSAGGGAGQDTLTYPHSGAARCRHAVDDLDRRHRARGPPHLRAGERGRDPGPAPAGDHRDAHVEPLDDVHRAVRLARRHGVGCGWQRPVGDLGEQPRLQRRGVRHHHVDPRGRPAAARPQRHHRLGARHRGEQQQRHRSPSPCSRLTYALAEGATGAFFDLDVCSRTRRPRRRRNRHLPEAGRHHGRRRTSRWPPTSRTTLHVDRNRRARGRRAACRRS